MTLVRISRKQAVRDIQRITKPLKSMCKHCLHGKKTIVSFNTKEYSTKRPLELLHTDHFGPMRTNGLNTECYFLLFIDDYTRMTWVIFIKKKLETFECFKIFKEVVENETDLKIKCLR